MKLTDWFPGAVKPVRNGVYQREYICGKAKITSYCYWYGHWWYAGGDSVEGAVNNFQPVLVAPSQSLRWRGVLK